MVGIFERLLGGWSTPIVPQFDTAALANRLGHFTRAKGERGSCLSRRQGRCPGLEFCEDCAWSEGNSRD
jgi:hypothetical protein